MKHILIALICFVSLDSYTQDEKNSVNFKITNYDNSDLILKLEKLELGIKLPQSIAHKVSNFVTRRPLDQINPYLEWELKVTAEFIHEDIDSSIFVDGFYSQKYSSYMIDHFPMPANRVALTNSEYESLGGYTKIPSDFNFFVRFAPPLTGEWKCRIIVKSAHRRFDSEYDSFLVIASENKGFLSVGENKRYLKLGDSSFYPLGGNAPWPSTTPVSDPELASLSKYKGKSFSENYRAAFCLPRVYDKYKDMLTKMADGGSNSYRMMMYPSCTEIEWEEMGNYTARLHMAQELDEIVEHAKENNLIIDWNTQIHYTFQYSDKAYFNQWTWEKKYKGKPFCYRKQTGSDHPVEFFRDEKSIKYYQQKLRYVLARWGYSTNIGIFELVSEINNIAESPFNYNKEEREDIDKTLTKWMKTMGNYMKSHHNGRIHLLTCSFAGNISKDNDVYSEKTMDIMSSNIYDFQTPSFGQFWIDHLAKRQLNEKNDEAYSIIRGELRNRNPKPLIYSETGVLEANERCDFHPVEMNRLLWQSLFSGIAAAYDWEYWSRKDLSVNKIPENFINQYQLDRDQWHPGSMKIVQTKKTPSWVYVNSFAKRMEGANKKADLTYLRSGDRTNVIGVITNTTVNMYSTSDCADEFYEKKNEELNWAMIIDTPEKVKTNGRKSENLRVKHLKSGKYLVEYFLPTDLNNPIHTSSGYGPSVKIEHILGDQLSDYIVIIKIRKF